METKCTSETLIYYNETTRHNIPEGCHLHNHHQARYLYLYKSLYNQQNKIKCLNSLKYLINQYSKHIGLLKYRSEYKYGFLPERQDFYVVHTAKQADIWQFTAPVNKCIHAFNLCQNYDLSYKTVSNEQNKQSHIPNVEHTILDFQLTNNLVS
jgi:hypothetical protein